MPGARVQRLLQRSDFHRMDVSKGDEEHNPAHSSRSVDLQKGLRDRSYSVEYEWGNISERQQIVESNSRWR